MSISVLKKEIAYGQTSISLWAHWYCAVVTWGCYMTVGGACVCVTCCWCTVVSCKSECCSDDIFLIYSEVSGEYAACIVMIVFCTWMLQIEAENSFENCWIDGGEKKGPDQLIVSMCVIMLHWKQRLYVPRNSRCKLTKHRIFMNCLLLFHQISYAVKIKVLHDYSCVPASVHSHLHT
jgi:hypothetical protein